MGIITKLGDMAAGIRGAKYAHRRVHWRLMETDADYRSQFLALMNARGYRSASSSKTNTSWLGGGRTADSEIVNDLDSLCSHSRELNRDDPIASGLQKTFVTNIIGTGIRPQSQVEDAEKAKLIERVFADRKDHLARAEELTYSEMQSLVMDKALEDGNILIKKAKRKASEPLWFEFIEVDRLGTPSGKKNCVHGVQKDDIGVRTGYWVTKNGNAQISLGEDQYTFINSDVATHMRLDISRPGQTMGVPLYHAIQQDLRDLDLLLIAALKRVQIAACLSVFIKSPGDIEDIMDVTSQKYGYQLDQTIEPGMMFKLQPDEEVQTLIPNFPVPEFVPFVVTLARRIGSALGVCWQTVLHDFSSSTYSSARTDLL